ncbi:MAG: transposase [Sulfitobacter sp.]|nr:transposase [Sulfitobacter sp.]
MNFPWDSKPHGICFGSPRRRTIIYDIPNPDVADRFVAELAADLQDDTFPAEVNSLGRTLTRWHDQIVAWHRARATNGPAEAINNLVKRVKRVAFGFRSFRNYRVRSLLYAGRPNWDLLATVTPAEIRSATITVVAQPGCRATRNSTSALPSMTARPATTTVALPSTISTEFRRQMRISSHTIPTSTTAHTTSQTLSPSLTSWPCTSTKTKKRIWNTQIPTPPRRTSTKGPHLHRRDAPLTKNAHRDQVSHPAEPIDARHPISSAHIPAADRLQTPDR